MTSVDRRAEILDRATEHARQFPAATLLAQTSNLRWALVHLLAEYPEDRKAIQQYIANLSPVPSAQVIRWLPNTPTSS